MLDDALLRVKKALLACDFHLKCVSLNVFFKWFFSTHYIYCVHQICSLLH
jgi:hypothetical protein